MEVWKFLYACAFCVCVFVCVQTASPPPSLDFVICEGCAEALLACVCVRLCAQNFIMHPRGCNSGCASAREHGETLFTVFFFFRRLDCMTAADGGVVLVVVEVVEGGCWIRRGMEEEGAGRDGGGVIRRLTGEPLSFMLIEGARTELHRQLTCPSRCSLWFSTSVKTGSHFVSPLFICLTTQNIMEHRGAQ